MPRITDTGTLASGVVLLGNPGVCLFLLQGRQTALVDNGLTIMAPMLIEQLRTRISGAERLDLQLITHSHYDHLSNTPLLLQHNPQLTVAAHPRVGDIVARKNAVALIRKLNETLLAGLPEAEMPELVPFEPFDVTRPLADGDRVDLGNGMCIDVLSTPGHTRDSLCFHLPARRMVICGEAAGVPGFDGRIQPEFLRNFDAYVDGLERLARLDLDIVGLPHNGILTGTDARTYMQRSLDATFAFRDRLAAALDTHQGDRQATFDALMGELYTHDVGQPKDAFALNLRAMIDTVADQCMH